LKWGEGGGVYYDVQKGAAPALPSKAKVCDYFAVSFGGRGGRGCPTFLWNEAVVNVILRRGVRTKDGKLDLSKILWGGAWGRINGVRERKARGGIVVTRPGGLSQGKEGYKEKRIGGITIKQKKKHDFLRSVKNVGRYIPPFRGVLHT